MTQNAEILRKSKLLILSGDSADARTLAESLKSYGFAWVHSVTDPRWAYRMFANFLPDIVIIDSPSTGGNLLGVLSRLAGRVPSGHDLPIVMLTEPLPETIRRSCVDLGVTDFVHKSCDQADVTDRVYHLLEERTLGNHVRHRQPAPRYESLVEKNAELAGVVKQVAEAYYKLAEMGMERNTPANEPKGRAAGGSAA